jgi:hypothetical protein
MSLCGQMTVGLLARCRVEEVEFVNFEDASGGRHPPIPYAPYLVRTARSSHIRKLRQAAIEKRLPYTDVTREMLGVSAHAQLVRMRATLEQDLVYLGICLFGPKELLTTLTCTLPLVGRGNVDWVVPRRLLRR